MRKNVAGQTVTCKLLNTDGSAFTGGSPTAAVKCYVSKDGAARSIGGGTSPSGDCFHVGGGTWAYFPTQDETNADCVTFSFEPQDSTGVPADILIYPRILTAAQEAVLAYGIDVLAIGTVGSGSTDTLISSDLTGKDVDHWKGRTLTFATGALAKQSTDITASNAVGDLTVTALTGDPNVGDVFVVS